MPIIPLKPVNHTRARPLLIADRRSLSTRTSSRPQYQPVLKPVAQRANKPILLKRNASSIRTPPLPLPPSKQLVYPQVPALPPGQLKSAGKDKILIIVGNGMSHSMADLPRLKNNPYVDMMSVNKPDERIWPTSHWFFCDHSQLTRHRALWEEYRGILINTTAIRDIRGKNFKIKSITEHAFSMDMEKGVHVGRSSVYAAMQIALYMGYDHIYIFGCDMSAVDGKLYPWGSNPDVKDDERLKRFKAEAVSYERAATTLSPSIRSRFTFCSEFNPFEFVDKFNRIDHKKAIEMILENANIIERRLNG